VRALPLPLVPCLRSVRPVDSPRGLCAGSAIKKYGEERWAKTFTVHTKSGPRWVAPEVRARRLNTLKGYWPLVPIIEESSG
jgi:hypothetical protein